MKQGKTLQELGMELSRQRESQKDFIAGTGALKLDSNGVSHLSFRPGEKFPLSDYSHGQLASYLDIPKKYYDLLREESPLLLDTNVNYWLQRKLGEKRLIRTMDGKVRAILSDRYRTFDNYDVAEYALAAFKDAKCEIVSCEITEKRFYLKALSKKITSEVAKGDVVQAGLVISNSEIGAGSLRVEPLINRLVCENGLIAADSSFRRNHVGKALGGGLGESAIELLTDETKEASDKVVLMQVRDIINATLTHDGFKSIVERFRASKEDIISKSVTDVVEVVKKNHSLNEKEGEGVLIHLIKGGDLSRFGLVNAITAYSQEIEDYDRATEFERLGGQVLELSQKDWKVIAE